MKLKDMSFDMLMNKAKKLGDNIVVGYGWKHKNKRFVALINEMMKR